ncbi:MAG: hypothetical protein AAGA48_37460 [Myxococcota bacterium]
MSPTNYTPRERGVMLTLMAEASRLSTVDLKEKFRLDLSRKSRQKLEAAGLIEVGLAKNPVTQRKVTTFELTDRGWAWASQELTQDLPKGHQGQGPLYAVLNNLARFMKRQSLGLADVFGRTNDPKPKGRAHDLEAQVRQVYGALADRPGALVKLADLREQLGEVSRADLDTELTRLVRAREILLEPEDDGRDIAERDQAAALPLGGQQNHWIAVR